MYGVVESAEGPIEGVVVSDGVLTTTTDAKGVYQLKSAKESGFVFMSVPSGYEPPKNGAFPEHYKPLVLAKDMPESASFTLNKVDQTNYKVIFIGDMHVTNRKYDKVEVYPQFKAVATEINNYAKSLPGKVYGITLGDMTWDLYWYSSKYDLNDYAKSLNELITAMPVYHTIGNHDNDMNGAGLGAKNPFITTVAPPYYSFNIGGVHYVVLDNINTSKYVLNGGEDNRTDDVMECGVLYDPQVKWIAEDLKYVDKSTPIIVTMHVPIHQPTAPNTFVKEMKDADKVLAAFDGYNVHYVTGHTHRSYNVVPEDAVTAGRNIYEHNLSAICSDWWWSGRLTPGLLQATDGTPSGYGVWDITGKDMKWIYKCTGMDEDFQFRAYDLNKIKFSLDDVPLLKNQSMINRFNKIIAAYNGSQIGKNEVLINVWGMNSRWKVEVKTKDGQVLDGKFVSAYDPIQILANTVKRFNDNVTSAPMGAAQERDHFYKVVAPDADTDLIITVKDEFGHSWTETMERPKAFTIENYKINI